MNNHLVCVICANPTEFLYAPKKSKIGLQILICSSCGFVQSSKSDLITENLDSGTITSLSCDADYSPIRVGKQQMTKTDIDNIDSCTLEGFADFTILDMASARGQFADWAHSKTNNRIVCIESDEYMTETYSSLGSIELHVGDYRDISLDQSFDFIYSCHTLEHFSSPRHYLSYIFDHLVEGGYFYVNVPNLSSILDSVVLDDFFYDKHRVYFDPSSLSSLLVSQGFQIVKEWIDAACLRYLVKKDAKPARELLPSNYTANHKLISSYEKVLHSSRSKLPKIVERLFQELEEAPKVVVGCGRMLDALVSYGNLDLDSIDYLVDNFIGLATRSLYDRDLYTLDNLPVRGSDMQFIVVARTSNFELRSLISKKYEGSKIFFVADFFGDKLFD